MKNNFFLFSCIIVILVGLASFGHATVTIAEFFDPATQEGFYDVSVDNDFVVAFAVGNDTATDSDTERSGWDSSEVEKDEWNSTIALIGLPSAASFENIFGAGVEQAVAYWDNGLANFFSPKASNPIGPTESDNRFAWLGSVPASNFVVFTSDENGNVDPDPENVILGTTTVVPEPVSTTLFIVGGATLGFRRFWRKKRNS